MSTAAQALLVLAAFFLPFREAGGVLFPRLSEIFIVCATVCTFFSARERYFLFSNPAIRRAISFAGGLFFFFVIGTLTSVLSNYVMNPQDILSEYARLTLALLFFILIATYAIQKKRFLVTIVVAFCSSAIGAILALSPAAEMLGLLRGNRILGFMSDPNYFGNIGIASAAILASYALFSSQRSAFRILAGCAGFASVWTILASGSRSSLAGLVVALMVLAVFFFGKIRASKAILPIILFVLLGSGIFFAATDKIISRYSGESVAIAMWDRLSLWNQAAHLFIKNPLGYGPGYGNIISLISQGAGVRLAHNIILETGLTAGIGGLGILLYALYLIVKKRGERPVDSFWWVSIGSRAAFFGVITGLFFLDGLTLRWLWGLAGIVYASMHHVARGDDPKRNR